MSTLVHTCGLILDQISQCRVPSKLPQMCQENRTFAFNAPPDTPSVSHPPPKMVPPYSLGICPPKTPPSLVKASSLLHREKINFLKAYFLGKLLERPWSHQKLTYVKIDQEGS